MGEAVNESFLQLLCASRRVKERQSLLEVTRRQALGCRCCPAAAGRLTLLVGRRHCAPLSLLVGKNADERPLLFSCLDGQRATLSVATRRRQVWSVRVRLILGSIR